MALAKSLLVFLGVICASGEGFLGASSPGSIAARRAGRAASTLCSGASPHVDLKGEQRLKKFLEDCELLGPCRFIVGAGEGKAILECVAEFEKMSFQDNKESGRRFVTLSADGNDFEAHLNLDAVKGIEMTERPSANGEHQLYITRFLDDGGGSILTMMLHRGENGYEEGSVQYFEKLRKVFGEKQDLTAA